MSTVVTVGGMCDQVVGSLGRGIPWSEQVMSTGLWWWCQPGSAWSGTKGLQSSVSI